MVYTPPVGVSWLYLGRASFVDPVTSAYISNEVHVPGADMFGKILDELENAKSTVVKNTGS